MLIFLSISNEIAAQNYYLLYGPDATNDGKYLEFIILGDRGSSTKRSTTIGSYEKAYRDALKVIDLSQYSDLINLKYDSSKSSSNGIVFINPTWCTYTFKPDFRSVIIDPQRTNNHRVLKLVEFYQLDNLPINSSVVPFDKSNIRNVHSNNQHETNSNSLVQPTRQFKCAYCNGSGRIEKNDNAPASFGQSRANKKCNECGKIYDPTVFTHYHVQCRHCRGTGNTK